MVKKIYYLSFFMNVVLVFFLVFPYISNKNSNSLIEGTYQTTEENQLVTITIEKNNRVLQYWQELEDGQYKYKEIAGKWEKSVSSTSNNEFILTFDNGIEYIISLEKDSFYFPNKLASGRIYCSKFKKVSNHIIYIQ